jgi:MoxR-like ATPase
MSEGQVSVDGQTYVLEAPFFVLATQNPFEYEGTYPLPENQLDRFTLCIEIGYPDRDVERQVLTNHRQGQPVDRLEPVMSAEDVVALQAATREVRVDESINDYVLNIVAATREHDELQLGVSTRGAITFYRAAQSLALASGREFVVPDDVKQLAIPVLAHRVICRGHIRDGHRQRARRVIRQIVNQVAVPD